MVVLDTCCILELCKQPPSLSEKCMKMIDEGSIILSISFAEIACKIKLGKLILNISAEKLFEQYINIKSVRIVDIGCKEWFDSISLKWEKKDPADRLIVSYAKKFDNHIATTDKEIKKYYKKVIW